MTARTAPAQAAHASIHVRRFDLPNPTQIPRHWFLGLPTITAAANAINLLFPSGERFFIRSVLHHKDQVTDPELQAAIRAFVGQEVQHGRAHAQAEGMLEAQGFEIRSFLDWYEHLAWEVVEPKIPPAVRLATTVALEHFTATLAHEALTEPYFDHCDPGMAELLRWHACEEIEHKAVAFEVFQKVDGRYPVRVAGLVLAAGGLMFFWGAGIRHLLAQEPGFTPAQGRRERVQAEALGTSRTRFLKKGILSFLRPSFHPDDVDDRDLARSWLARMGRLAA